MYAFYIYNYIFEMVGGKKQDIFLYYGSGVQYVNKLHASAPRLKLLYTATSTYATFITLVRLVKCILHDPQQI